MRAGSAVTAPDLALGLLLEDFRGQWAPWECLPKWLSNSIRGPASHLDLVGLRSTIGATSRDGIVPLLLNRDVGGPLTRTVTDTAIVYSVISGVDPADPATAAAAGRVKDDYTVYLKTDGLQGARLGVLRALVDSGRAHAGLIIPAGYGNDLAAGGQAQIAFVIDGSDPGVANTVLAASQSVGQAFSTRIMERATGIDVSELPGVQVRPRVWYNPELKSRWFFVPAVLALVLMSITLILASMGVVREKEIGTMEQIMVTPIRPCCLCNCWPITWRCVVAVTWISRVTWLRV